MSLAIDSALSDYLSAYKSLIETDLDDPERDDKSITLSFPFHLAAGHRIELTITDCGGGRCLISDSARTHVYLVHKRRSDSAQELINQVRTVLNSAKLPYRPKQKIQGRHEAHIIDLLVPSNGIPGLALNVLEGQNTHALAQVWYCKCDDIRLAAANKNIKLALIYDVSHDVWSEASKGYLEEKADVVLAGDSIQELPKRLTAEGVIRTAKREARARRVRL